MSCKYCEDRLIDYIDNRLEPEELEKMEQHLNENNECKNEYISISQVTSSLKSDSEQIKVPSDLMAEVRNKINIPNKRKRTLFYRRGTWVAAILFSFLFVSTAVATNGFNDVLDWWKHVTEEQQQRVDQNIEHGLGERVNLEAISNDIKVTITDVIADDLQTHIYYEIEDLSGHQHYMVDFHHTGTKIRSTNENWSEDYDHDNGLRSHMRLFSDQENVVKGRLGLSPLATEEGTISLQLSELEKVPSLFEQDENYETTPIEERELFSGHWTFDIPVKKHPAIVKDLNIETEINGNSVTFSKLTIAPTVTTLRYEFWNRDIDEQIIQYLISGLEAGSQLYERDDFAVGGGGGSSYGNQYFDIGFESMYFTQPDNIQVLIDGLVVEISEKKQFEYNFEQPETFEYLGTTISIEDITLGNPTTFTLKEEFHPNRKYETLSISYLSDNNQAGFGTSSTVTGLFMDASGNVYDIEEYFFRMKEFDQPRFFTKENSVTFYGDNDVEMVKPSGFEISGYTKTMFFDQKVEIDLR
ncbi:DUF4179 domain-containing protein [Alkalihalobacillus sp. MEB130]|uniref:DUF4179 domain-containing protein n=1 Tax=Alkalihalobacillus sp. MEB130 TaxID=2976704 RepID=UPI0028DFE02A|nr:DUF4179 domain-containing protein [Alkalihalobacillus sp. MEB130]MDT8861284.1 DUF4179 domain-containing protein [Alkalihalobacillus sp. MEB130]